MTDIEAYRACWRSTESLSARLRSLAEEFEDNDWGGEVIDDAVRLLRQYEAMEKAISDFRQKISKL